MSRSSDSLFRWGKPCACRVESLSWNAGWIWWAHWGCNLSHMHYFALKGDGPCLSSTGSDTCRVKDTSWLASNWSTLTQDAQDNLRHIQLNKQRTLSCLVIVPLLERHWGSQVRGCVASRMDQLGNELKGPGTKSERTPQSHAHFLLYLPLIYIRRTPVTLSNYITVICFFI